MQIIIIFISLVGLSFSVHAQSDVKQLFIEGKYEEVIKRSNEQIEQNKADSYTYLIKGRSLEQLFNYNEAINSLEQGNKLFNQNIDILSTLAGLYVTSGMPNKAVDLYDQLMDLEPSNLRWRMNCAIALQASGQTRYAIQEYSMLMMADSMNWVVFKNLGDCYVRVDELKIAASCYKKSLEHNPKNLVLAGQLAGLYVKLERPKAAIGITKQALTYDSTFLELMRWQGIAYYTAAQNEKDNDRKMLFRDSSLRVFEQLWELKDTSAMVSRNLGMLYYNTAPIKNVMKLDEIYAKSEMHLQRALIADPENMDILFTLGVVCGLNKKPTEGLAMFDTLNIVLEKYDMMKAYTEAERGLLYRQTKQYDKALQCYQNAMKLLPDKSAYLYEIAVTYDYAGRKKQAIDWYKRFLTKLDPDWERKSKNKAPSSAATYENIAIGRINTLDDELFFEDKK